MQRSPLRREGSPFTGLGPVFMKEFSDHLSSARMMVLMLFVIAFGALPVGLSLQELRSITESDPFLFLRIFTSAPQPRHVPRRSCFRAPGGPGAELAGSGLYLDLPPWGHHVFFVTAQTR
jgi:hypothetical protein